MKNLLFLCVAFSVLHESFMTAFINAQDKHGTTALICAAQSGILHHVESLIDAHAHLDIQNENGTTALMKASMYGHTEIAMRLISSRAKLDVQDWCGNTALIKAAACGNSDIVRLLIEFKADLTLQNDSGETALIAAAMFGQTESVKLLIPAMKAEYEPRFYIDRRNVDVDLVRQAMIDDLIHPLDMQNTMGRTALMEAALYGHAEIVRFLIDAGADPCVQDNDGETAHFLVMHGCLTTTAEILAALENRQNLCGEKKHKNKRHTSSDHVRKKRKTRS
ncbi:MAG: ankyrin repeat domain-containing protein [Candidatus Babeliales bacterium]|jgi:ankyrin repeat protein